jgi:hypothetical protein
MIDFEGANKWAISPPIPNTLIDNVTRTPTHTVAQLRNVAKDAENEIGSSFAEFKKLTNQWTTNVGESLVYEVLKKNGKNPRRPKKIKSYLPDWETDDYIYEVKTRTWTTPGTAGEKVLGAHLKYSEVPKLYGKPLRIVCVAYQEYELRHGNESMRILGDDVPDTKREFLDFARERNIEYVGFSDLESLL